MSIDALNRDFGIRGQLGFVEGTNDFPLIEVDNGNGRGVVSLYGGQVLSFRPADHEEDLLFLSEAADFQDGKAVRGGIPICWPWFGSDPEALGRAAHGFARTRFWAVSGTESTDEGDTVIRLGLSEDSTTRDIWPHAFDLKLTITIGKALSLELTTRNTGGQSFKITQALHAYFRVGNISQVRVIGLADCPYLDKVAGGEKKVQLGDVVIASEIDRIYLDALDELTIEDASLGRRIRVNRTGSRTAVLWNPGSVLSAEMKDLEDSDYKRFVCVEAANAAGDLVEVLPGGEYRLGVRYAVERR